MGQRKETCADTPAKSKGRGPPTGTKFLGNAVNVTGQIARLLWLQVEVVPSTIHAFNRKMTSFPLKCRHAALQAGQRPSSRIESQKR